MYCFSAKLEHQEGFEPQTSRWGRTRPTTSRWCGLVQSSGPMLHRAGRHYTCPRQRHVTRRARATPTSTTSNLKWLKKTKCSSAQLEGIEPGPYCSCKVWRTTMPLQRLFPVLWFFDILYYLATRQLWTTYSSNIVKSYKNFMSALYIHKMILWHIKYEFYTIFLINSGGTCSSNWNFFL